ncbi:MAG: excalibur calcium-binding domain-containing protein [Hydrogenophaga sp.]|nr:excalibur calcium-binding domain-containing protein [Hydrogenophaga sp.]
MTNATALRQTAVALVFAIVSVGAMAMNKCMVNGTVTYQQTPCQTVKVQRDPTVEELNAEAKRRRSAAVPDKASAPTPAAPTALNGFSCDKRQYCSQMTSCTEAKFFLSNCPGVKMDGDKNGIPCEQQWCSR